MRNLDKLRAYIADMLPYLDAELQALSLDNVRIVLNAALGMSVKGADIRDTTCADFLAALRKADSEYRLYLDVLPKALRAIKEIAQQKVL